MVPNHFRLGVRPFQAVGIGEEAHLLVDWQHVEPFFHNLADYRREEIVPPVASQARNWAVHGTACTAPGWRDGWQENTGNASLGCRLIISANWAMVRCDSRLPVSNGKGSAPKAELENDLVRVRLQSLQESFIHVGGVDVAFLGTGARRAAPAPAAISSVAHRRVSR